MRSESIVPCKLGRAPRRGRVAVTMYPLSKIGRNNPSPLGRRWRAAPDEGNPPHDFVDLSNRGAGLPHPALRATLSRFEREPGTSFEEVFLRSNLRHILFLL